MLAGRIWPPVSSIEYIQPALHSVEASSSGYFAMGMACVNSIIMPQLFRDDDLLYGISLEKRNLAVEKLLIRNMLHTSNKVWKNPNVIFKKSGEFFLF